MPVINLIGKPIVAFLLVVLFMAVGSGILAANYDPFGQAAVARQLDAATEHQRQINELDLRVKTAQAEADLERITQEKATIEENVRQAFVKQQALDQAEVERQNQLNALELQRLQRQGRWKDWVVLAGIVTIFTGVNALIASVIIKRHSNRPPSFQIIDARARPVDLPGEQGSDRENWNSPEYCHKRRLVARQLEQQIRSQELVSKDEPEFSQN